MQSAGFCKEVGAFDFFIFIGYIINNVF